MKLLVLFLISFSVFASTVKHEDNVLKLGQNDSADIYVYAENGNANSPYLFYDFSEARWKSSDDGLTSKPFGTQLSTKSNFVGFDGAATTECVMTGGDGDFLTRDSAETCGYNFVTIPDATFQNSYGASTQPQIVVDGTNLGMQIRDALVSIADDLFEVLSNDGLTKYFNVDAVWAYVNGQEIVVADTTALDGEFVVRDSTEPNGYKYTASLQGKLNPVTDWVDCTITGTWANTTYTCKEKQVGDEITFKVMMLTTGTITGAPTLTLPNSYVIDTSKIPHAVLNETIIGSKVLIKDVSGSNYTGSVAYGTTTTVIVKEDGSAGSNLVINTIGDTSPFTWVSGDFLTAEFTLPIVGKSSGLDAAVQGKTYPILHAHSASGEACSTTVACTFSTEVEDSTNSWDGKTYTAPESGEFIIVGSLQMTTAPNNGLYTYVNGVKKGLIGYDGTAGSVQTFNGVVKLTEGDTLELRNDGAYTSVTTTDDTIYFIKIQRKLSKAEVIAGTFENIDSTDLVIITAEGNASEVMTNAVTPLPFIAVSNPDSAWSGTAFTVPSGKSGMYTFSGIAYYTASLVSNFYFFVDSGSGFVQRNYITSDRDVTTINAFFGKIALNEGDIVQIRGRSGTLNSSNPKLHYLTITQSADYEAIVKNLYADNITECNRKYLTADITADNSDVADLKFTDLVVGKKYEATLQADIGIGAAANAGALILYHDSVSLTRAYFLSNTNYRSVRTNIVKFVATTTTLISDFNEVNTATLYGNSTGNETWIQLCKLPDTTILNN